MNLKTELLQKHSKKTTDSIVAYIGTDQVRMDDLVLLFLEGDYCLSQRASWPIGIIGSKHPELIAKHMKKLVAQLDIPGLHPAVIRNTLRFLQEISLPEALESQVLEQCVRFVKDPKSPVAIKAFAITILGNLCIKYPELGHEVKLLIEEQSENQSPAFRHRAKLALKKIRL